MKTKYFSIHVNEGGGIGYSVPIAIEVSTDTMIEVLGTNDNEIINEAVRQGRLDADDRKFVDSVDEIEKGEYNDMKNI